MIKKVLLIGAGLVSRPIVRYLLDQPDYQVVVGDCISDKAEKLIEGHPRGTAVSLHVDDKPSLKKTIAQSDLVVSLVPYAYHPVVAELCIELKKPMVTTSYVSDAMRALHKKAKHAGIIILNEIGLDPGFDHMSAMRIIHRVKDRGGRVVRFYSYCGGLPAPESNTNPFGYKFSWSPRGVVLAGRNDGRYLKDGKIVEVQNKGLFAHHWGVKIDGLGTLQAYPNRNSLPYIDLYGLQGIASMFRGTLRNPGWCDTWYVMVNMGLLDLNERDDLKGLTFRQFIAKVVGTDPDTDLKKAIATKIGFQAKPGVFDRLEWLGLFSDESIPEEKTYLDVLSASLLKKLSYEEGERDMIVLHHEFLIEYSDGRQKEKITSTLVDFGIPGGDTSMARTVSLPAAIASKLILEGKIKETGVHIPVIPTIYKPVLGELETMKIVCKEKSFPA